LILVSIAFLTSFGKPGVRDNANSYLYLQQAGKKEEEEFSTGPLSVLMMSVKNNTQVQTLSFSPAAIC